jgi:hypothetical protein
MTMKHEALRLFLALTALILTVMLTNPNDPKGSIGIDKNPSYSSRKITSAKKKERFLFKHSKKRVALALILKHKTANAD